ncbi:MAG: CDP-alcohol phosphatidyltransferase family protein [Candidatus Nanopelagicaceae bacterium]|jgi:phosphatidylglycerophosphate synthase
MKREEFFLEWSSLHGGAEIKGIVKAWLSISFAVCKPLRALRITPNALTCFSLVLALAYLYTIETHWAIAFLVLSLMADGVDGTLAIMSKKVSKWGAALDSIVDRVVETLWALGLFQLGAPWEWVLLAWLAAYAQEYMRARAGGLGVHEIGVVTICERPIRASIIFIVLVARVIDLNLATSGAIMWAFLQTISALTVLKFLRPLLRQSPR